MSQLMTQLSSETRAVDAPSLYPWQAAAWAQLAQFHDPLRAQLPHALLLHGPAGIGKVELATLFAQSLLCEHPDEQYLPCGTCPSCRWFAQESHIDCRIVRPEALEEEGAEPDEGEGGKSKSKAKAKPSQEIRIEQVRSLAQFVNVGTHRAGLRIVLVYPVQALNVFAANALLKTLEEPTPKTLFILVANGIDRLLPTILSRCRQVAIAPPLQAEQQQQALEWLAKAGVADPAQRLAEQGGMPLSAWRAWQQEQSKEGPTNWSEWVRALSQPTQLSPLKLAEQWQKADMPLLLQATQRWSHDIGCLLAGASPQFYPQQTTQARMMLHKHLNLQTLTAWQASLRQRQRIVNHPLNPRLFVEELLLEYVRLFQAHTSH